jgi:L-fuconolactonase
MRRVDAHLHLWDLDASDYAWLTPDLGVLYRSFAPDEALAELRAAGFDGAVLVQAEDSERDTRFMLEVAEQHPWVDGVVGWVRLDDPRTAEEQLDRWQESPWFCGVRHLVHEDPREVLRLPEVLASLCALGARGLAFDVPDAWPRHLDDATEVARRLPDLTVVVDHLAKPPDVGAPEYDLWRSSIAAAAALPNTVAKVSGLQPPGGPLTPGRARPLWETALELFGPSRLLYGSDWPMTTTAGGYQETWRVLSPLIAELSTDEQSEVLGGTASRVYGLRP